MRDGRRDTLRILSDILEDMIEPRRITRLLHSTNLSYTQLSKYLKMVITMGLVKEQTKPFHSYQITHDGKFFMYLVNKRQDNN